MLQCITTLQPTCRLFLPLQLCGAGSRFLQLHCVKRVAVQGSVAVSEDQGHPQNAGPGQDKASDKNNEKGRNATVIKKYANRRLYNTATSTYVTLEDLAKMVKEGVDFVVFDAKTGEEITRSVLTQIIFEEEGKEGNTLLPINFLRQLIRFYGDSMQGMVPGFLEFSMGNLAQEQDKLRQQMSTAVGGDAFKLIEETTKRNMQLFQDSLKMFTPFGGGLAHGLQGAMPPGFVNPFAPQTASQTAPQAAASKPGNADRGPASRDDLQVLREQMAAMQEKLEALNRS
jgi:polyhydroxyalkanoate synthesis repressor PhaR